MTHVATRYQARSQPNRRAPVNYDRRIIDSQKTRGAVVHRAYDARLIDR